MRGKVLFCKLLNIINRITPAYAGKSGMAVPATLIYEDHPRLCGEKAFKVPERSTKVGSPPPMRGKAGVVRFSSDFFRITPAYAGKSGHLPEWAAVKGDHPRLCGEKCFAICVGGLI